MNKLFYTFAMTLLCARIDAMDKVLVRQKNQKNIQAIKISVEEKEAPAPITLEKACEDIDEGIRKFAERFYWAGQDAIDYNNQQYEKIDRAELWLSLKQLAKEVLRYDETHSMQRDLVIQDSFEDNE